MPHMQGPRPGRAGRPPIPRADGPRRRQAPLVRVTSRSPRSPRAAWPRGRLPPATATPHINTAVPRETHLSDDRLRAHTITIQCTEPFSLRRDPCRTGASCPGAEDAVHLVQRGSRSTPQGVIAPSIARWMHCHLGSAWAGNLGETRANGRPPNYGALRHRGGRAGRARRRRDGSRRAGSRGRGVAATEGVARGLRSRSEHGGEMSEHTLSVPRGRICDDGRGRDRAHGGRSRRKPSASQSDDRTIIRGRCRRGLARHATPRTRACRRDPR